MRNYSLGWKIEGRIDAQDLLGYSNHTQTFLNLTELNVWTLIRTQEKHEKISNLNLCGVRKSMKVSDLNEIIFRLPENNLDKTFKVS